MATDRQIRVAKWLKEDGSEKVIAGERYYFNDPSEEEVRVYEVAIDGELGADPAPEVSFQFGPIDWRKPYSEIDSEFDSRDLQPFSDS